ncbi:MAG: glycosyltransferase [Deferribacteres bacterium]|nr:glycosyltransferase [candidate division KSB1 bacterium]MCB9501648.1 glycosyltransferase [Deferribacteres bacterium]
MKISTLLPVFNAAATIESAVNSILTQTFTDFELIIVDDGSNDGTPEILRSSRDPRIKILRQEHAGIVAALNHGLSLARGEFIARMDADDISLPRRFEKQVKLLKTDTQFATVGCSVEIFPKENVAAGMRYYIDWLNSLHTPEDIRKNIFVEMPLLHPTLMLRTNRVKAIGGYRKGDFPEDYDLLLRLYAAGGKFDSVPEILFRWREHANKLSRQHSTYRAEAYRELKLQYVVKLLLEKKGKFLFWGVGRDGKLHARSLSQQGWLPEAFIDINPKKIGHTYLNRPIIAPDAIPNTTELILCCVGTKGARPKIRNYLLARNFFEGEQFWFLA